MATDWSGRCKPDTSLIQAPAAAHQNYRRKVAQLTELRNLATTLGQRFDNVVDSILEERNSNESNSIHRSKRNVLNAICFESALRASSSARQDLKIQLEALKIAGHRTACSACWAVSIGLPNCKQGDIFDRTYFGQYLGGFPRDHRTVNFGP